MDKTIMFLDTPGKEDHEYNTKNKNDITRQFFYQNLNNMNNDIKKLVKGEKVNKLFSLKIFKLITTAFNEP